MPGAAYDESPVPTVSDIASAIARRTRPDLTPAWDPAGLQIGDPEAEVAGIAVCHEVTEDVVSVRGARKVAVPEGFSAAEVRLVGAVTGKPPFSGVLTHAGWRARKIELPQLSDGHDVHVIAAAEVEL
jgi:hypothetical protein